MSCGRVSIGEEGLWRGAGGFRCLFDVAWLSVSIFLLAQVGAWFARSSTGVFSPIWPASGLAIAAALAIGLDRTLPAVYLGTALSNLACGHSSVFVFGQPFGNVAETLIGWALLRGIYRVDPGFSNIRDFVRYVVFGCLAGPLVSAIWGVFIQYRCGHLVSLRLVDSMFDYWQANALGLLIFGLFFLFVFRRQDFRPPTTAAQYELLLYCGILAMVLAVLVAAKNLSSSFFMPLLTVGLLLALVVSWRFGLRSAMLFQAMFVFLIPAFVAMSPGVQGSMQLFSQARLQLGFPVGMAFLASFGCLLLAVFRDELISLQVKFDLAMESADLCVWEWSESGWFCHTPAWRKKFGMPSDRLINDDAWFKPIHPDDIGDFLESFHQLKFAEGEQWTHTYRMKDVAGDWLWVQAQARTLRRNADNGVAVLAGVTRDISEERRAVQTKIAAIESEAELKTLRSQLNPHFLFNALNSVRALIGRHDERARTMITSLSNLLRDLLSARDDRVQSVSKEIEIVKAYLEIESIRFGDRLKYKIECEPDIYSRRLPCMVLLTLVENAVKHGISQLEAGGLIEVSVSRDPADDRLRASVINDGALGGPSGGHAVGSSGGFGLTNTRRRIALMAGAHGTLNVFEIPGPRVEAVAIFPSDARRLPV